jgi:hypothetical protein
MITDGAVSAWAASSVPKSVSADRTTRVVLNGAIHDQLIGGGGQATISPVKHILTSHSEPAGNGR